MTTPEWFLTAIAVLASLVGAWATFFRDRGDRATTIVGQWEALAKEAEARRKEDKAELFKALADLKIESREALAVVNHRLDQSVEREMVFYDYTRLLRNHIMNGSPPPPPQWPKSLLTRFPDE